MANVTPLWLPSPATSDDRRLLPPPQKPMRVARSLVADMYSSPDGVLTLRRWRGGWWRWCGSRWREITAADVRTDAYRFTENALYETSNDRVPWSPNRNKIANVLEALGAITHTDIGEMPAWVADSDAYLDLRAEDLVACANGLLHVPSRRLLEHSPFFFNQVAVPFSYESDAPRPLRWLRFLDELWPNDPEAIATLQEFFGYVISGRTNLHKILLLIGPTRAGKGTIARVLRLIVGKGNYAGPTLASLGTTFGLSALIGKPLAIISDARLGSGNADVVVERLLSVSGEDGGTVDVKYRQPWTGTLPTRFLVISNELPRFGDTSGAIANRFIVLTLGRSWLGRENPNLTAELHEELPGIFAWTLDGLERLARRGHFVEPQSSADAVVALRDLVSPVAAFVREQCELRAAETPVDDMWVAWGKWCEDNGHRPGNKQSFGRDLHAVVPGLRVVRPRDGDARLRAYVGIALR